MRLTLVLDQCPQLRTRIAHQLVRLQHNQVLPPTRATDALIYLHSDVYDQVCWPYRIGVEGDGVSWGGVYTRIHILYLFSWIHETLGVRLQELSYTRTVNDL